MNVPVLKLTSALVSAACSSSSIGGDQTLIFKFSIYVYMHRISLHTYPVCRSQWPRDLRRRSTAARPLRLCVRIPPGAWMSVCCECCVSSRRGLCDGLITRPDESYRLWRVVVCDRETSNEEAKARYGVVENTTKRVVTPRKQTNNYPVWTSRGGRRG
jgi:hypothetical protein